MLKWKNFTQNDILLPIHFPINTIIILKTFMALLHSFLSKIVPLFYLLLVDIDIISYFDEI